MRVSRSCDVVRVKVCRVHQHDTEPEHIRVPEPLKMELIGRFKAGASTSKVKTSLMDSDDGSCVKRTALRDCDLSNIRVAAGLQRPSEKGVPELLQHWQDSGEATVFLKKFQGQALEPLASDDLAIGWASPSQLEMLARFGKNVVSMDSTHNTAGSGLILTSVLVEDNLGQGCPVAWLLSSRENATVMSAFLKCLKEAVLGADLEFPAPRTFMSDCAEAFYTAWLRVADADQPRPTRLLCAFHVVRAWRSKLSLIKAPDERERVAAQLEAFITSSGWELAGVVSEEEALEKARRAMASFADDLIKSQQTRAFGRYFRAEWSPKCGQWAAAFRRGSFVTTNNLCETWHSTLKRVFLEPAASRTVEGCMEALQRYNRERMHQRQLGLRFQTKSSAVKVAEENHETANRVTSSVVSLGDGHWSVSADGVIGVVRTATCPYTVCYQQCGQCQACVHQYTCTCPEGLRYQRMCVHVHLVHSTVASPVTSNASNQGAVMQHRLEELRRLGAVPLSADGDALRVQKSTLKNTLLRMLAAVDDLPGAEVQRWGQELSILAQSLLPSTSSHQQPAKPAETPTAFSVQPVRKSTSKPKTNITGAMARAGQDSASILTELLEHGQLAAARASLSSDHSYGRNPATVPPASTPSSVCDDEQPRASVARRWRPSVAQASLLERVCDPEALRAAATDPTRLISSGDLTLETTTVPLPVCVKAAKIKTFCNLAQAMTGEAILSLEAFTKDLIAHWECADCKLVTAAPMIGCDGGCNLWYHYRCAGITQTPESVTWVCRWCRLTAPA